MNSLPPKDYASLPKLEPPAAYICVLRDIDRDVYRIDSTDHPAAYVDMLLAETTGAYGIELLSILETEDIAASEMRLYERHHATLGDRWLELDAYQLMALRKSELRILDYNSHYISQRQSAAAATERRSGSVASSREQSAAGQLRRTGVNEQSPLVLDNHRDVQRSRRQRTAHKPDSWRQSLSDKIDDIWHRHPGLVIAVTLLLMLLFLIHFWRHPYPY